MMSCRVFTSIALCLCGIAATGCSRDPQAAAREFVASGDRYVERKQLRHAIIQYRNAIQRDPSSGEAHFRLASAYEREGDGTRSARAYMKAAELLPDSTRAQIKAGQLELLAGEFEAARARAERVLERERRHVDAQILRANALAGLNELNAAVAQIQDAVHHHSGHSGAYANLGTLRLAQGRHEEAERAFRRAVSLAPHSVPARLAMANFYWVTGSPDRAEQTLEEGLVSTNGHTDIRRALAFFYLSTDRAREAERHLLEAVKASGDSDSKLALADYYELVDRSDAALPLLESIAAGDRDAAPDAVARVAAIYAAAGRDEEAAQRLDALIAERPDSATARVAKARLLLAHGRPDEALSHARRAVRTEPGSFPARLWLARALSAHGNLEEAGVAYEELLSVRPAFTPAFVELAQVRLDQGRPDDAYALTAEALERQPEEPELLAVHGEALYAVGRPKDAAAALRRAAAAGADSAAVQARIGSTYVSIGEPRAAVAAYERARRLAPGDTTVANNLAWLLAETGGDMDAALRLARLAYKKHPDRAEMNDTLGWVYHRMGRPEDALPFLRAAVDRQPANAAYRLRLGLAYEHAGNDPAACDALLGALRIDPGLEDAADARRRLNGCQNEVETAVTGR